VTFPEIGSDLPEVVLRVAVAYHFLIVVLSVRAWARLGHGS
jgi:hypothetical protein